MVKNKHPEVTPVVVRWVDSMGCARWEKYSPARLECTSVGHLVTKTKDRVVICMTRSCYSTGYYMSIPMCAVKSIKKLKL